MSDREGPWPDRPLGDRAEQSAGASFAARARSETRSSAGVGVEPGRGITTQSIPGGNA